MNSNDILDLKTFVPAKDYTVSQKFYADLGFTLNWSNEQITEFQIGAYRFLLQNFYVQEHANNFVMHLQVADTDEWWQHIQDIDLIKKYPGSNAQPPKLQPWGLRVLYLTDPTGVLWHIADRPIVA